MQLHGLKQARILVPNRGLQTCLASPTLYKPTRGDKSLNVLFLWLCYSDGVLTDAPCIWGLCTHAAEYSILLMHYNLLSQSPLAGYSGYF